MVLKKMIENPLLFPYKLSSESSLFSSLGASTFKTGIEEW